MRSCKGLARSTSNEPHIGVTLTAPWWTAGEDIDAIKTVAKAYQERSLQAFQAALAAHKAQLQDDPIVHSHLAALYDTLLEQNLCRLIEPFSRVEIGHVAELIKLPLETVLAKLSQVGAASGGDIVRAVGCCKADQTSVHKCAFSVYATLAAARSFIAVIR